MNVAPIAPIPGVARAADTSSGPGVADASSGAVPDFGDLLTATTSSTPTSPDGQPVAGQQSANISANAALAAALPAGSPTPPPPAQAIATPTTTEQIPTAQTAPDQAAAVSTTTGQIATAPQAGAPSPVIAQTDAAPVAAEPTAISESEAAPSSQTQAVPADTASAEALPPAAPSSGAKATPRDSISARETAILTPQNGANPALASASGRTDGTTPCASTPNASASETPEAPVQEDAAAAQPQPTATALGNRSTRPDGPVPPKGAASRIAIGAKLQAKQADAPENPNATKTAGRKKDAAAKADDAANSAVADSQLLPADGSQTAMAAATPVTAQTALPIPHRGNNSGQAEAEKDAPIRIGSAAPALSSGPNQDEAGASAPPANAHDNLPGLLTSQLSAPIGRLATPAQTYAASASSPSFAPTDQPVVAAQAGRIGRDMGVEIARQVASGRSEVLIRLDPAEMGRIDVHLSFDDKGSLHAAMAADSPAALDLLRRDAGDLGRALADAGIRSDVSSFRFDSRSSDGSQFAQSQGQSSGDARDQRGGGTSHHGGRDDADSGNPSPHYRQLRASGRIDLMA